MLCWFLFSALLCFAHAFANPILKAEWQEPNQSFHIIALGEGCDLEFQVGLDGVVSYTHAKEGKVRTSTGEDGIHLVQITGSSREEPFILQLNPITRTVTGDLPPITVASSSQVTTSVEVQRESSTDPSGLDMAAKGSSESETPVNSDGSKSTPTDTPKSSPEASQTALPISKESSSSLTASSGPTPSSELPTSSVPPVATIPPVPSAAPPTDSSKSSITVTSTDKGENSQPFKSPPAVSGPLSSTVTSSSPSSSTGTGKADNVQVSQMPQLENNASKPTTPISKSPLKDTVKKFKPSKNGSDPRSSTSLYFVFLAYFILFV